MTKWWPITKKQCKEVLQVNKREFQKQYLLEKIIEARFRKSKKNL